MSTPPLAADVGAAAAPVPSSPPSPAASCAAASSGSAHPPTTPPPPPSTSSPSPPSPPSPPSSQPASSQPASSSAHKKHKKDKKKPKEKRDKGVEPALQMRGAAGFELLFRTLFGSERWNMRLRPALLQPPRPCARLNPFVPLSPTQRPPLLEQAEPALATHPDARYMADPLLRQCWVRRAAAGDTASAAARFPAPALAANGLTDYYAMDLASVVCAWALAVQPGERVLDMCAAPGGKSLVLAQAMGDDGSLVCNEPSRNRRIRLTKVLSEYLPPEVKARVEVAGHDGSAFGHGAAGGLAFDAVLVDAPCSSERHVLADKAELAKWGPKRPKEMAARQLELLMSAVHATRPGGRVLYSTCALSPRENDEVVAKALKKLRKSAKVAVARTERIGPGGLPPPIGSPTELGWSILPDVDAGWGPIYFTRIDVGDPYSSDEDDA